MDIHKVRYSFVLTLIVIFLIPEVSPVISAARVCAAVVLFYFLPGVFLARNFLKKCHFISSIAVSVLVGMCFHIVYIYFLSFLNIAFNIYILLLPGVLFSGLADYYTIRLPKNNPKELYLVFAGFAFFLLTCTIPLGEDANGHLYGITMIVTQRMLPHSYSLYPEISLSYHMGFDVIAGELAYTTQITQLLSVACSLVCILLMWSSYLCVRTIHTEKAGLIAGILVVFGVIPPLYYLSYGAYASITAFAIQPLVIFLLYNYSSRPYLLPLVLAAGFMSHSSFVLFWIPLLFLKKNRILVPSCAASMVLSIPHLVRFQPGYSAQEITQLYHLWYAVEVFRIQMLAERIGVLILICGVLGFLFLKRKEFIFFLVWLLSLLLLAGTSVLGVEYPFWFIFFANRLVDMMFLPLALVSAVFVSELLKKYFILVFLLILPMVPHFYSIPRSTSCFPDNPEFAADLEGIQWLSENTDENTIILNDWWTGTGSAWVTSVAQRRVIFPFLYVHDHFLDILDVPERGRDIFWIGLAPDTERSQELLQEWGVDYIFLSSYVEDRVRWRRDLWIIQRLAESPNYSLVFNKDETFIFKVRKKGWGYTNVFTLREIEVEQKGGIYEMQIPSSKESFPLTKMIVISYVDSFTDIIEVWMAEGLVAKVPLSGTGNTITVVLPCSPFLHIKSPEPLQSVECRLVTDMPVYSLGSFGLSPDWIFTEYLTLQHTGHVLVFGAEIDALTLEYNDDASGNIDIYVLVDETWNLLQVIERAGDGSVKKVTIPLPQSYHFLDIRIRVHGPPLKLISFTVI